MRWEKKSASKEGNDTRKNCSMVAVCERVHTTVSLILIVEMEKGQAGGTNLRSAVYVNYEIAVKAIKRSFLEHNHSTASTTSSHLLHIPTNNKLCFRMRPLLLALLLIVCVNAGFSDFGDRVKDFFTGGKIGEKLKNTLEKLKKVKFRL